MKITENNLSIMLGALRSQLIDTELIPDKKDIENAAWFAVENGETDWADEMLNDGGYRDISKAMVSSPEDLVKIAVNSKLLHIEESAYGLLNKISASNSGCEDLELNCSLHWGGEDFDIRIEYRLEWDYEEDVNNRTIEYNVDKCYVGLEEAKGYWVDALLAIFMGAF